VKSIRRHLLWTLLIGVAVSTVASGYLVFSRTRQLLVEQYDAILLTKARSLFSMLEVDDGYLEFNYAPWFTPEFEPTGDNDSPEYFELWYGPNSVRGSGTISEEAHLERRVGTQEAPEFFDVILPDGRAGRSIGISAPVMWGDEIDEEALASSKGRVDDDDDDDDDDGAGAARTEEVRVDLVVSRSRSELDSALARSRSTLWLSGGALILLVGLVVFVGVGRGLRPITRLGREVADIGPSRLSARVRDHDLPVELSAMATKLNELLGRVEAAFLRERRVTGNIAHELRTPIAELRAAAEIAKRWPDDLGLGTEAIDTAAAVSVRMGNLIEGLLRLARVASGESVERNDVVDVGRLVEDVWVSHAETAKRRGIQFINRTDQGPLVLTDKSLMVHAIGNLLENAAHHATAGSTIVCDSVEGADGHFSWTIDNEAEGLDTDDLTHLTEPFWQKDSARADGSHSGLGLALVASIARALGLRLDLQLIDDTTSQALRISLHGETTSPAPSQIENSTAA